MNNSLSRRSAIARIAGSAVAAAAASISHRLGAADAAVGAELKGHINHSACRWCYKDIPLDDLCAAAKQMGMRSIELLGPKDFPTLQKHGLVCAMVNGVPGGIGTGLNRLENHDKILAYFEEDMPKVAEAGFPNMICFSGNRKGMDDQQGLENCAIGAKRIAALAEKHKITVCMELLNSKHNHPDYMCDHSAWGVELCKRVGSDRFKLLYDIYHMQIMEGDVVTTIKENHKYFGHFHTGGVPGRHEIDNTQELYYPAVMRAIVETGYKGFVSQEFVPTKPNPLDSLRECVAICDV
jgi:hydroxypyruvate isomerase